MKRIRVAAAILILIFLLPFVRTSNSYVGSLQAAAGALLGKLLHSDVATDFYGFRAMMLHEDPYATLGPALKTLGLEWDLPFQSTHPPTAYLLVAPVAWMPWPLSGAAWAWLMLIALWASFRLIGYSWNTAVLLTTLALLWPSTAWSLSQLTVVWLLGIILAYKLHRFHPGMAGMCIAIASFTKFLPVMMLIPFIMRHNWRVMIGFLVTWLTALGALFVIDPNVIPRYLEVNSANSLSQVLRPDNAAPIGALVRAYGPVTAAFVSVLALCVFLALAIWAQRRRAHPDIALSEWNYFAYLSVAFLPIAWIYSILPLLPLLTAERQRWDATMGIAVAALVVALVAPPFTAATAVYVFVFLVLSGWVFIARLLSRPSLRPEYVTPRDSTDSHTSSPAT